MFLFDWLNIQITGSERRLFKFQYVQFDVLSAMTWTPNSKEHK